MSHSRGETVIRGCCRFFWVERPGGQQRAVRIKPEHCPACRVELRVAAQQQGITLIEIETPDPTDRLFRPFAA